jgi:carbon starvation protein
VVSGGGIATSSILYLALPIAMGLLLRFTRLPLGLATVIFLPLVALAIQFGQSIPLDVEALLDLSPSGAQKVWGVALILYCIVAAMVPVWLLLQPRGHLGGYFLFAALAGGLLGIVFGGKTVEYPMFLGWESGKGGDLFPFLFITIACGACSGFHALIASGTTSKQLRLETDARPIAYGSMLLEALVAVVSLACVMMLAGSSSQAADPKPSLIYAQGIGGFLEVLGVPAAFAVSFGLMAFTTFVYDTLDVCTRLGRYIVQELLGRHDRLGKWIGTIVSGAVPLFFVTRTTADASGQVVPAWKTFWTLFGASNQLLAALTLIGVTVWLWRTRGARWVWWVTGLPTVWMYCMSVWALASLMVKDFRNERYADPVPWASAVLIALAVLMLVEAVWIIFFVTRPGAPRGAGEAEAVVTA